jgi:hypothetical protein
VKTAAAKKRAENRTRCKNGHELTPENVKLVVVTRNGWLHRECKKCRAEWDKRGRYTAEQITAVVEQSRAAPQSRE